MKKFYLLLLCCIAATSCTKTDDPNSSPLVFEQSELTVAQYTSTPMVAMSNKPEGATITYQSSNTAVATVENGMIVAKTVGQTFISAFVEGDFDASLSNTLTVKVEANLATGITLNYPADKSTIQAGDTVQAFFTFNPATTTDHKVTVVSTDSVGMKYLTFEVKEAKKVNVPDTLNIVGENAGEATFFLEQKVGSVTLASQKVSVTVTPTANAGTGLTVGVTPEQLRKGLAAPTQLKIGGKGRLELDTIAVDFLPDNFSAKPLKVAVNEPGIAFATEVTFKDIIKVTENGKIVDKKVVRRGVAVTPIKAGSVTILITSTDGYQIGHSIRVNAADPVIGKYAAVKSIKFKKRAIEIPVLFSVTNATATPLPEAVITFKDDNVSPEDVEYTKSMLVVFLDNAYAPTGDTLPSKIKSIWVDGNLTVGATLGTSGHGYARAFAGLTDPDGKAIGDTCMIQVTGLPDGMVFKPTYDFADAKFTVNALINPVDYRYGLLQPGVKASLIYTKPVGEKEKPVAPVVKETITLDLSPKGNYYLGSFASFADGARLAGYSVKYEFELTNNSGGRAKYFYEAKTIEVNTGTSFAPKR